MKKSFRHLLHCSILFALCLFLPLKAQAAYSSGDWQYEYNSTGVTIVKYTGNINYGLAIPSTIAGKPVTVIGTSAFSNQNLYGVGIPTTVTELGNGAFCGCRLSEVTVPANVNHLGYGVFSNNSYLSRITFMGNPKSMYEGCLGDDKSKTIRVYRSASKVISYCQARSNRFTLEYMKTDAEIAAEKENAAVPTVFTVTDSYGTWTFDRTTCTITKYTGTAANVTVPETFTYNGYRYKAKILGTHAIRDNAYIKSLTIHTPRIESEAVYNNKNLTNITLDYSVMFLGPYCFWFNDSLNSLYVPGNPVTTSSIVPNRDTMFINCNWLSLHIRWYCYINKINDIYSDIKMDERQRGAFWATSMNGKNGLADVSYWLECMEWNGMNSAAHKSEASEFETEWDKWLKTLRDDEYFAVTGQRRSKNN